MKNIAIFGSPRSGKSTLAKMISKKYPTYHIISGDIIRFAFQNILPQNQINETHGTGMISDFPNYLAFLFHEYTKTHQGEFNYIIETCDITPEKADQLFNTGDTIILFLGTPKQTAQNYFNEIKNTQTEKDWTYNIDDQDIIKHCEHWIPKSQQYQQICQTLGLKYIDTSFHRHQVLQNTLNELDTIIHDPITHNKK